MERASEPLEPLAVPLAAAPVGGNSGGPAAQPTLAPRRLSLVSVALVGITVVACSLHGYATWRGLGGWREIASEHPIARHDHPIYFHVARITPSFLQQSGTTAGYDPTFMAGYAKSVIFPASSTLVEVVFALLRPSRPAQTYKIYVLIAVAALPWLIALAGWLWRFSPHAVAWAVSLYLAYLWSDFPINYAEFGMVPYLLVIPVALLAVLAVVRFLAAGGVGRWLAAAFLCAFSVLTHLTAGMIVVPAAAAAYFAVLVNGRPNGRRPSFWLHAGVFAIPVVVLAANAFWWWPGIPLASTKGASDFAFAHSSEDVNARLGKIFYAEARIEPLLVIGGVLGILAMMRRVPLMAAALGTYFAAGYFWGYRAGKYPELDFLQPGRHTYAFYTAAAVALGFLIDRTTATIRAKAGRGLAIGFVLALAGTCAFWFGGDVSRSVAVRVGGRRPFLSSHPTARQRWVIDHVRANVRPGERLLYEEGGFGPDPYLGRRISGLLPYYHPGIEILGGPYLHASLATNFTQFGEGALFGKTRWGRDHFVQMASLYRPSAIVCWSAWARRFCYDNRDLVEVVDDDGEFLFGRIRGFGGAVIQGSAEVQARPGRLRVVVSPSELDGTVILRYHSVPCLRSNPEARLHSVLLPGDPVPFIGLKPPPGIWSIELNTAP